MRIAQDFMERTLVSGAAAGIATTVTALIIGKRETGSLAAPLNATSHAAWGEVATHQDAGSLKYTAVGLLFNSAASLFWAALYEKWFAPRAAGSRWRGSSLRPLVGAAVVTAGAYVTDYYLVPKRLTPGFEKRISGRGLTTIYGALALGFLAGRWINDQREHLHSAD